MKVAIVTAHYMAGRGYMENVWAHVLAGAGHRVAVLASSAPCRGLSHAEHRSAPGITVTRFPSWNLPSGIRLAGAAIVDELERFRPDAIFWINLGSHFGKRLLDYKRRRGGECKLICFFGENSGQHAFLNNGKRVSLRDRCKTAGWRLLRGPLYQRALSLCDMAVGVTAETPAIVASLFAPPERERVRAQFLALPLGYDGAVFSCDEALRSQTRRWLGLSDDHVVLAISSRMTRKKIRRTLSRLVAAVADWVERMPERQAILVGFDGSRASARFCREVVALDVAGRLTLHDLADRPRLNALFNAADIGVFASPSISVQEAMGTGLYVVLSDDGSMNHLVRSPRVGSFYRRGDRRSLHAALDRALPHIHDAARRGERQAANAWLDYHSLAQKLLARLSETGAAC